MRYNIARSRSGDSAAFVDMVNRCKAVGVGIYVDAVINHMTNYPSPGTGSNGSAYSKYDYPGLYTSADFHTPCTVTDYSNAANVQDCELLSLPDLNTELPSVRDTIAGYLIKLARLGVAGFRIDAAKHIQQVSLDDIFAIVDSTMKAEGRPIPYYFLEVSTGPGEALGRDDYFGEAYGSGGAADITEFIFKGVGDKFVEATAASTSRSSTPTGPRAASSRAAAWGLMPSDKAVVFLQNHDTQHQTGSGTISYRDGNVFRVANVWMLAQPYGYPSILSSYAFVRPRRTRWDRRRTRAAGRCPSRCASSLEAAADDQFVCEHRDPYILHMVAFRKLRRRHGPEPLVGRRRQRHRLLARHQGLRGDQPRGHDGDSQRRHGHAAGHLLRPPDRRALGRRLRRHVGRRGLHRLGPAASPAQHGHRDRRRNEAGEARHEARSLRRLPRGARRPVSRPPRRRPAPPSWTRGAVCYEVFVRSF